MTAYVLSVVTRCEFLHDVLKKNTAEESERENDVKVANQMRHLSTREELMRTSSLLMDYSKLLFFMFSHNFITTKRLKTLQLF